MRRVKVDLHALLRSDVVLFCVFTSFQHFSRQYTAILELNMARIIALQNLLK